MLNILCRFKNQILFERLAIAELLLNKTSSNRIYNFDGTYISGDSKAKKWCVYRDSKLLYTSPSRLNYEYPSAIDAYLAAVASGWIDERKVHAN